MSWFRLILGLLRLGCDVLVIIVGASALSYLLINRVADWLGMP